MYQALHGAVCLHTGQADLAITLAETPLLHRWKDEYTPLWREPGAIGWPPGLPHDCTWAWAFLQTLPTKWPWLLEIFDDEESYQSALSAYYMALNVFELAWTIANTPAVLQGNDVQFDIPPMFFLGHHKLEGRPLRLLIRSRDSLRLSWARLQVSDAAMRDAWPKWMGFCKAWMFKVGHFWTSPPPHTAFFKDSP